jgi:hypothetical protein
MVRQQALQQTMVSTTTNNGKAASTTTNNGKAASTTTNNGKVTSTTPNNGKAASTKQWYHYEVDRVAEQHGSPHRCIH